jgi:hypothetical protein
MRPWTTPGGRRMESADGGGARPMTVAEAVPSDEFGKPRRAAAVRVAFIVGSLWPLPMACPETRFGR